MITPYGGKNKMKEYDVVEVIVEKEKYAKQGVHKGMKGTILDPRNIDGQWLVAFEDPITFADEIIEPIKEEDLKIIYEYVDEPIEIAVEVIAEKQEYAKQGIHKGKRGMVYDLTLTNDCLEVNFDGNNKALISRMDLKQIR